MSAKKIIFILSIFVFAIIGSTFLLKPAGNTHNLESKINNNVDYEKPIIINYTPEEYEIYKPKPSPYHKICSDLTSVDFVYPYDITEDDDFTATATIDATSKDGVLIWDPSEYKVFYKSYFQNDFIAINILCFYKNKTNDVQTHYYEESAEELLSILHTEGDAYTPSLKNSAVYSIHAGEDFVSYKECSETEYTNPKYYFYCYISPGDPEIRAYIQYSEDFKEQFDSYIDEFEKTIKRK